MITYRKQIVKQTLETPGLKVPHPQRCMSWLQNLPWLRIHAACSRDAFYCEHEQSVTDTAHALPLKATGIIKILVKGFGHLLAWPLCGTAAASDHRGAVLPAGYKATQAYRDDGSF